MDFYVNFEFDENFNEKLNIRFREDHSYQNLSQGEKQRINLAIIFAWREISKIKNSININLLIMDEVFDSSLDEEGTECLFKILNDVTNSNIFIISHKKGLEDKFNRILKVKLSNNYSKVIEA